MTTHKGITLPSLPTQGQPQRQPSDPIPTGWQTMIAKSRKTTNIIHGETTISVHTYVEAWHSQSAIGVVITYTIYSQTAPLYRHLLPTPQQTATLLRNQDDLAEAVNVVLEEYQWWHEKLCFRMSHR